MVASWKFGTWVPSLSEVMFHLLHTDPCSIVQWFSAPSFWHPAIWAFPSTLKECLEWCMWEKKKSIVHHFQASCYTVGFRCFVTISICAHIYIMGTEGIRFMPLLRVREVSDIHVILGVHPTTDFPRRLGAVKSFWGEVLARSPPKTVLHGHPLGSGDVDKLVLPTDWELLVQCTRDKVSRTWVKIVNFRQLDLPE